MTKQDSTESASQVDSASVEQINKKPDEASSDKSTEATGEKTYWLPSDDAEQERLNMQNNMCKLILEGRFGTAPLETSIKHALDIGTGTGIWVVEFGQRFPECQVIGTDRNAIQPQNKPPNVTFLSHDAEKDDWSFDNIKFDYIHMRYVVVWLRNPLDALRKAYDSLAPGGYLEIFDPSTHRENYDDDTAAPHLDRLWVLLTEATRKAKQVQADGPTYKEWLEEVGFTDITETEFPTPTNPWPTDERMKQIGAYQSRSLPPAFEGFGEFLIGSGMPEVEVRELVSGAIAELLDPNIHINFSLLAIYGRKPMM